MTFNIDEICKEEIEEATELLILCFGEHTRETADADIRASFIENYPYRPKTFVVKVEGRIIGLVQSLTAYIHPNTHAFSWLATHPEFRRVGVAKSVLQHAENEVIKNKFKGSDGTFLLIAACEPSFYRNLGYIGGELLTHDGPPFMVKYHRSNLV